MRIGDTIRAVRYRSADVPSAVVVAISGATVIGTADIGGVIAAFVAALGKVGLVTEGSWSILTRSNGKK